MRLPLLTGLLATIALTGGALAQSPKPGAKPPASAPAGGTDPVIATVGDEKLRMSDLVAAEQGLPAEARQLPQDQIYPKLLERMVASKALVAQAKHDGLDRDPAVQKELHQAEDNVLQNALLKKEVAPQLTEEAIKAKFDAQVAGKPVGEEVHARHILVDNEAQATDIIAQLKKGAKFEDLAKKYSKDPAAQNGGDLGFFKKEDMLPEFSDAAFGMKAGEYSQKPVHTRYGWHVIEVVERRTAQPPTYVQARDAIRQQLIQEGVAKAVAQAKAQVKVAMFNPDGTPMKAPPAAAPAAGK